MGLGKKPKGKPVNHRRSRVAKITNLRPDEAVKLFWDDAEKEWRLLVDAAAPVIEYEKHEKKGDNPAPGATS